MSNAHSHAQPSRCIALLVMSVLGCSRDREALPADPSDAAARITALAATGCDGFARALASLDGFHGRPLIELVDDAIAAAPPTCAVTGASAAAQLARARKVEGTAALAVLTADDAAIRIRRAELLDALGRGTDALRELDTVRDPDSLIQRRLIEVGVAARAGGDVAALIAAAPITERTSLAFRAAADAPTTLPVDDAPAELATAIADRLEHQAGPAAALAARARAASAAPAIADHHDALARAQIAAGDTAAALASWDRAAQLAPAQPAYRITPIRALVIANQPARAKQRAAALAAVARAARDDVELRLTASLAAAAAGDHALAIALGREARALRPADGRLAFELAHRHAEAGDRAAAAAAYAELLVCGAHGRPWHRHEVAAKLAAQGDTARAALAAKRACAVVDADDLATYTQSLR